MITKFKSIKCHGCGKIVSITYEKFNKNKKLCSKCEEANKVKMVNGGTCSSCGESVGKISREKQIKQNQDKGYGICAKCEKEAIKHEEKIWDQWLDTARKSLTSENQEKWDKLNKNVKKAFILKGIEEGTIKIG